MHLSFDDVRHAVWAVWQLGTEAEVLAPDVLRTALHERARIIADRYVAAPPPVSP